MVTQAIDYFEENGTVYLVTKYVGVSLRTYLEQRKQLTNAVALKFLQQIAVGLQKLHERGIVHGGLTLDAIKVRQKSNGMIALYFGQFDLAKIVRHTATTSPNKTADSTTRQQNNDRAANSNATQQPPMQLNLRRVPLAPELVVSADDSSDQASLLADGKLADVWQFGQLAYQFLCCSAEKSSSS